MNLIHFFANVGAISSTNVDNICNIKFWKNVRQRRHNKNDPSSDVDLQTLVKQYTNKNRAPTVVSLSHPQLSPYGSAPHISPIRVWRRTLNCMVYSYQCLQIVQ